MNSIMQVKYQVFVSSTYEDLIDERKEVTQAILEANCIPAGMELFPASNKSQWEFIKKVIDESDFYLVIIAGKYGSEIKSASGKKLSYTEMEFNHALNTNKPIIALLHANPSALPYTKCETSKQKSAKLSSFYRKASTGRLIRRWSNKGDLKAATLAALYDAKASANSETAGWIRADYVPTIVDEKCAELWSYCQLLEDKFQKAASLYEPILEENYKLKKTIYDATVDVTTLQNNKVVDEIVCEFKARKI